MAQSERLRRMYEMLLVFHVLIAILLIGLVLIQHGKGAQAGAAFGSGASQTIFGSQGSGGFLAQSTWVLVALFFVTSLSLAYLINRSTHRMVTPITTPSIPQNDNGESANVPAKTNEEVPPIP